MTPQQIIRIDAKELTALEVRCKCGSTMTLPLQRNLRERLSCVGCNTQLWSGEMEQDKTYFTVLGLIRSLSLWNDLDQKQFSLGFSLPAIKG